MKTPRREAVRPPLSWSIEGSWCCGAPSLLGSKMTSGLGLQGFREEPTAPTQVMESLGRCRVRQRRAPGEGVQDPENISGSRLGFGAQVCRALGLFAVFC